MIVTARARWMIVLSLAAAGVGLWRQLPFVVLLALTLLIWVGLEWVLFRYRVGAVLGQLQAHRQLQGPQGPTRMLWESRSAEVQVLLQLDRTDEGSLLAGLFALLPPILAHVQDLLPTVVEQTDGESGTHVCIGQQRVVTLRYRIRAQMPGRVRFFGLRIVMQDLHGFFFAERFVGVPASYRVLPLAVDVGSALAVRKQANVMPPPGIHTVQRPGVGSELLEIRDYVPGDAPRSIAWKVSARRDGLMTKQFETEVPVRCQLFVDMSRAVRLGYPGVCQGSRLVSLAATIASCLTTQRDPVGLSVFDCHRVRIMRASSSRRSVVQKMDQLCHELDRVVEPVDVPSKQLMRTAWDVARIRYPQAALQSEQILSGWLPSRRAWRMRVQMAALLCNHYGLDELSMGELVDNDRFMSVWVQRFCAEHGAPWTGSLFNAAGQYLFDDRGKIDQLSRLIQRAASMGRDNELFVVLAELTDTEYDLSSLMYAIKFARARHHRVAVIAAWPERLPIPGSVLPLDEVLGEPTGRTEYLMERRQKENAFVQLKAALGKLRVPVVAAADNAATALILNQIEIVRSGRALV